MCDLTRIWRYTTCWILPSKISSKLKFQSLSWKPIPHWIISVQQFSVLLWKYLYWTEQEFFCWWEVSKLPRVILYANARKVHLGGFQIKIKDILRLRPLRGFRRNQVHLTFFIYLNARPVVLWSANLWQKQGQKGRLLVTIAALKIVLN